MYFPWYKYNELKVSRRNTLQMFITTACDMKCKECFVRKIKSNIVHMSEEYYFNTLEKYKECGVQQINILGGEPLMHPKIKLFLTINRFFNIKTTIYTNGTFLHKFDKEDFKDIKLRVSFYNYYSKTKPILAFKAPKMPFDANFMVGNDTTLNGLLDSAKYAEKIFKCSVFFISSIRELDNQRNEFFDDTKNTMNLLHYKELVHNFLKQYEGNMEIHISKRGVFESTINKVDNKCMFGNVFPDGSMIQCPYDIINLGFTKKLTFNKRFCQHNNSCLMSKIAFKRKESL